MIHARSLAHFKRGLYFMATHYTGAFITVITISILTSVFTMNYLNVLENDLRDVYENEIQGQDYVQVAFSQLLIIENAVKDIIIDADRETTSRSLDTIRASTAELRKAIGNATPRFYTPAGKVILDQSKKDMNGYLSSVAAATDQLGSNAELDRALLNQLRISKDRVQADFKHLIANKTANSRNGFHDIITQLRISLALTLTIFLGSIGIRVFMYVTQRRHQAKQRLEATAEPVSRED